MNLESAIENLGIEMAAGDLAASENVNVIITSAFDNAITSAEDDRFEVIEESFDFLMGCQWNTMRGLKPEPAPMPKPDMIHGEIEPGTPQKKVDSINSMIDAIRNLDGLRIEICGTWIWVDSTKGNPSNDVLKEKGFRFSRKKCRWSWHPGGRFYKKHGKELEMEDIREKYGSQTV